MAYDEHLGDRVRAALSRTKKVSERKMFGGIAFMVRGNMCCGVIGDELMVRVGPDGYEEALALPHARPMDFTGRPMRGMVYVGVDGIRKEKDLSSWVQRGLAFAKTLPTK